jgi:hypothetical protein
MFFNEFSLMCAVFGHKYKKVKDLRAMPLCRERIVYRCIRCGSPLVTRERDRRHSDRRRLERRQDRYLHNFDLKYTT